MEISDLKIIIENKKGSYKSFEMENDPVSDSYPLKGVTYPVDYGYIDGYKGEDNADLDVFVGSGDKQGYIKVWRLDVPEETKFFIKLNDKEVDEMLDAFEPVILGHETLNETDFLTEIEKFKK